MDLVSILVSVHPASSLRVENLPNSHADGFTPLEQRESSYTCGARIIGPVKVLESASSVPVQPCVVSASVSSHSIDLSE